MLLKTITAKLCRIILVCTIPGFITISSAQIISVQGSPQNFNLSLANSSYSKLGWRVTVNNGTANSFSSSSILIRAGSAAGPIVFTINKTITVNVQAGMTTHNKTETILIPAHVTYRIRKMNQSRVYITRTFSDNINSVTGQAVASLTGQIAAKFSISSLKLRIKDHTSGRIPEPNSPVVALASLQYNGSGIIRGAWEVATIGISTTGQKKTSIFRILTRVTQQASGNRMDLFSPALPAIKGNQYIVRFRILSPAINKIDTPTLTYSSSMRQSYSQ